MLEYLSSRHFVFWPIKSFEKLVNVNICMNTIPNNITENIDPIIGILYKNVLHGINKFINASTILMFDNNFKLSIRQPVFNGQSDCVSIDLTNLYM